MHKAQSLGAEAGIFRLPRRGLNVQSGQKRLLLAALLGGLFVALGRLGGRSRGCCRGSHGLVSTGVAAVAGSVARGSAQLRLDFRRGGFFHYRSGFGFAGASAGVSTGASTLGSSALGATGASATGAGAAASATGAAGASALASSALVSSALGSSEAAASSGHGCTGAGFCHWSGGFFRRAFHGGLLFRRRGFHHRTVCQHQREGVGRAASCRR